ncbi:energy transducer TonB [Pseudomonas viridiflava]|uniref:energy transducer TonB n=1 Tax=Pseudomonas viridiflava TaxID=33069 RepID=UPI000BBE03F3|nr:energy transducer TonB [Pseudomonas viridiflava]MCQ9390792.1 energy transducer TonB [Pseudomonas viridiflava]PCK93380.1 energy transducer TonB [Pseudomonas viridiflava]
MKWIVVILVVSMALMALPIYAAEAFLVPMYTPQSAFPVELVKARYAGKVRAQLVIKSDGSVHEAKAIESGHPLMTSSVEQTLRQWRYKPWIGTVGAPPFTSITVPVIFGSHGYRRFNTEVSVGLGDIRCGYLNHEVQSVRQDSPDESLSKVDVFWYTGQVLFSSHVAHRHTEHERKALLEQLSDSIPMIVSHCEHNPDHRYGDYLPASIKAVLVGTAESGFTVGLTQEAR